MKIIKVVLAVCLLNVSFLVFADDAENVESENSIIPGFIFNTNNILLDLDSYQGGLGVKLLFDEFALRGGIGGRYESGADILQIGGSFAFEYPLLEYRVVPYVGAVINVNYEQEQATNGDDWTRNSSLCGGLGGIIGAELYIFEHLSVFAEYEIAFNLVKSTITESIDGIETATSSNNYEVAAGLGNSASIGIVLYIKPVKSFDGARE